MGRRASGEGSVFRQPNGKWRVQLDRGKGPDGKRHRSIRIASSKAEAVRILGELKVSLARPITEPSRLTGGEMLAEWLRRTTADAAPATQSSYRTAVGHLLHDRPLSDGNIILGFASLPLAEITPRHVESLLGQIPGKRSRQLVYVIGAAAMKWGVSQGYLAKSPFTWHTINQTPCLHQCCNLLSHNRLQ